MTSPPSGGDVPPAQAAWPREHVVPERVRPRIWRRPPPVPAAPAKVPAKPPARKRVAVWERPIRLVDAAALAAGGLLVLKLGGLLLDDPRPEAPATQGAYVQSSGPPRTPGGLNDPVFTGSTTPKEAPKEEPKPAPTTVKGLTPAGSPTERAILERLGERREALQQRNRDLDVRERLIENAEKRLEGRIGDLKSAEDRAESGAAKRGEGETAALKNLVTMYEVMKPKDAARVFDRLPHDVLVPVVNGMNPRKMAEVLALMQPEAAEKLTVALANRARAPGDGRTAAALPPGELQAIGPTR